MRNLKKFLALVLAMMMAFSLMVTANAANEAENGTNVYGDGKDVTTEFVEAVDVLYGMGIMTGDYGNFKPGDTIMRSEMAAVLYRLMTGDTSNLKSPLYASIATERFSDVKETDWFAPYVGWCYDAGLTVGNNGKYNPWGGVTGYEAEIFVLRAMGYGKNNEYVGANYYVNASYDATRLGLLTQVSKTNFSTTLRNAARRDVVASIVFQAAQLPTVTWNGSTYNQFVGVPIGTGNNVFNPSLGEKNFGLTSHIGIVVGNKASGETGNYTTKISFAVNPTISRGLNVGENVGGTATTGIVSGTLTAAEITDVIDANAYYYGSDMATAQNVTLSFDRETNLDLFNHKVKVWYDNRGTSATAVGLTKTTGTGTETDSYNNSSISFGTNCKTYALYDQATAKVSTATAYTVNGGRASGDLGAVFGAGVGTLFNYAFAPMNANNLCTAVDTMPAASAASPIKANNNLNGLTGATTTWPLYLGIDNTGNGAADVVITLDLTISQVTQDNNTQAPFTTGILTQNGTGTSYFDQFDQVDPAATGDTRGTGKYSNIINGKMVDSDDVALNDYVAAVTVTGTTGANNGTNDADAAVQEAPAADAKDGNAGVTTGFNSTFYYKVDKLVTKQEKTLWKYDANTQECFFSDGTSYKKSIFANAVDGSFKANANVMAPHAYTTYTFYLDKAGDYLFWEVPSASSNFVYGTYIDWQTELASGQFIYPMVYVDAQGNAKLTKNITGMNATVYDNEDLPKRDATAGNSSGFLKGTYIGYALTDAGARTVVTDTNDQSTGFWQADTDNFGFSNTTTVIDSTGLAVGAVPVGNADNTGDISATGGAYNTDHLFFNNSTKFIVVDGAGTATQTATVYKGLSEFLGAGNVSVKIDAITAVASTNAYLDSTATVPSTSPWQMVYYSLSNETYDQIYDPSAKVIGTVFIPSYMVTRTPSVTGDLYFVGDSTASIVNATDNATLFTMYNNGVEGSYWITGMSDLVKDGVGNDDADTVTELGNNVFYQLVDTGRDAYDGGNIYRLLPMTATTANRTIIGQYYGTSTTTADRTAVMADAALTTGYLATTRNAQAAFIGGRSNSQYLYNVATANVKNLHKAYTINSLQDLNGQSSLTSNQGVNVSCVIGSNAQTIGLIYVNF